jgi:hypothetical protein
MGRIMCHDPLVELEGTTLDKSLRGVLGIGRTTKIGYMWLMLL